MSSHTIKQADTALVLVVPPGLPTVVNLLNTPEDDEDSEAPLTFLIVVAMALICLLKVLLSSVTT